MSKTKTLTAADIMQTDVVLVGPDDTLQDAMTLITENHVTGLPVTDSLDRCIGVVSASDILAYEHEQAEYAEDESMHFGKFFNPDAHRWEYFELQGSERKDLSETPVSEVMTRDLVYVSPETDVREIASLMEEKEVHRVLVLDAKHYLHGVVSAFDFVRLAAR